MPVFEFEFEQAIACVLEHAGTLGPPAAKETTPLLQAAGRVLARPLRADRDQPPFARSTRDGFAVRAAGGMGIRTVLGMLRAGECWAGPEGGLHDSVQIMTGAPLPGWADAVVMIEHITQGDDGHIRIAEDRLPRSGENVVARAAEAAAGDLLLPAGARIGAAEIAIAAACGAASLTVFARPHVAILATGDELVELEQPLGEIQIRNSNSYTLAALVAEAGGLPQRLPIARDLLEELHTRIAEARQCDLILLSGGVSMGEYDLVEQVLEELGATFFFSGVRMQPGKPVVFGLLPARDGFAACPFFGLPGNPISTQVTFHCFAEPLLRALAGATVSGPRFVLARLAADVAAKPGVTRLLPGLRSGTEVSLTTWQGSGDQAANARANCYVELLPGRNYTQGETVRVLAR